jgi:hypothetical protein
MTNFMKIVEHLGRPHFHAVHGNLCWAQQLDSIFKKQNGRHCIFHMRLVQLCEIMNLAACMGHGDEMHRKEVVYVYSQ